MEKLVEKLKGSCFFCSESIVGKKSREHIIPNSLLGQLGIKQEKLVGTAEFEYSRIKVPAHSTCNETFGSRYEERIINLLSDPERLFSEIRSEEASLPVDFQPNDSVSMLFSTWLSKIYYGLFYNDFLKIEDEATRTLYSEIIDSPNFGLVRTAYKQGLGFCLPSSLFAFESNVDEFDLRTMVVPKAILLKVRRLVLILCLEDGFLTKSYLNREKLEKLRIAIADAESQNLDFYSPIHMFAEILALRSCIPKTPKFIFSENRIVNMSFMTLTSNPVELYRVDSECVYTLRSRFLEGFIRSIRP